MYAIRSYYEAIENTKITLVYLPLGRKETIPVKSTLPLAQQAPAQPSAAAASDPAPAKRAAQQRDVSLV